MTRFDAAGLHTQERNTTLGRERIPRAPMPAPPTRAPAKRRLSALTRYAVIPMLLVALGIRLGMWLERGRERPHPAPVAPATTPAPRDPEPAPAPAPSFEMTASFQNNIYPSLMLSFGASYPEYSRCLSFAVHNLPAAASAQIRVESALFISPLQVPVPSPGAPALSPEIPWNYDLLRRTTQLTPQAFAATLVVDGRPAAEATLVCTVHSVNEAVSRIFLQSTGQWQDTSVCFAAFVNEDHPWINGLLQECVAAGSVRAFTGYQAGGPSALQQAQAVWEALAARGLSYVNVATDSGTSPLVSTQYVRFLDQSVHDQGANCVDASVLFASVLRRIGLRPVLIFRPGHCFTGFYDSQEGGRIVAFETTLLGSAPFAAAAAEGARELQQTLPLIGAPQYSVVDIALCRQQGINPIPYQATDRN